MNAAKKRRKEARAEQFAEHVAESRAPSDLGHAEARTDANAGTAPQTKNDARNPDTTVSSRPRP